MKGILKKTDSGWIVFYNYSVDKSDWCTLRLHPNDISDILSNPDSKVENLQNAEVDFEMTHVWENGEVGVNGIPYAKLTRLPYVPSITLKERVLGVLKWHSIERVEDDFFIIEERDWNELADSLISCFEQFGNPK